MRTDSIGVGAILGIREAAHGVSRLLAFGNFHIFGIAVALTYMTGVYFEFQVPLAAMLLVAFGAQFVYITEHLLGGEEDRINHPKRASWISDNRLLMRRLQLLSLAGIVCCIPFLKFFTLLILITISGISLAYFWNYSSSTRTLREIPYVKSFVVSGVWAVAVVLLVAVEAGFWPSPVIWIFLGYRWILLLANVLYCDLSDRDGDRQTGLTTIAVSFSDQLNRRVIWALIGVAVGIAFFLVSSGVSFLIFCEAVVWISIPILARHPNLNLFADLVLIGPLLLIIGLA